MSDTEPATEDVGVEELATTAKTKDWLGRLLVNPATNGLDFLGRAILAGDKDYLGRALV